MPPLATAFVRIRPDFSVFKTEADAGLARTNMGAAGRKAGAEYSGGLKRGLESLKGSLATVGVLAFAGGLGAAVKAGAELELTTSHLRAAVERTGMSWERFSPILGRTQKQMEGWGFAASDTNLALVNLIRFTGSTSAGIRAVGVAANVAAAKNIDLNSAVLLVRTGMIGSQRALRQFNITAATGSTQASALAKAEATVADQIKISGGMAGYAALKHLSLRDATDLVKQATAGSIPALNKLGVEVLPATATSAERAGQFLQIMSTRVSGAAAERVKTFSGQIGVLKAEATDFAARASMVVLPALTGLLRAFTGGGHAATIFRTALVSGALALAGWKALTVLYSSLRAVAGSFALASLAARAYTAREILAEGAALKLSKAERVLALTMRGLANPVALVAGSVAALGVGFVVAADYLGRNQRTVEQWIAAARKQYGVTGQSVAGFEKFAAAVKNADSAVIINQGVLKQTASGFAVVSGQAGRVQRDYNAYTLANQQLTAAQKANVAEQQTINAVLGSVSKTFSVTREEALKLAYAAGVQEKDFRAGGLSAADLARKIDAYGAANLSQHAPTRQFSGDLATVRDQAQSAADRVTALTDAYNKMINPEVSADDAAISLANDLKNLNQALRHSQGEIGLNTAAQRNSFTAWDTSIKDANNLATQVAQGNDVHHKYRDYLINTLIPALYKAAGADNNRRQEVRRLAEELKSLPPEVVTKLSVTAQGRWNVQGLPPGLQGIHGARAARGLYVTSGTTPTADDVLARVSKRELIVPANMVDAGEVDHLRGRIPGFKRGGRLRGYARGTLIGAEPYGLGDPYRNGPARAGGTWVPSEMADTQAALAIQAARTLRAALRALQSGGAGIVRDALRWVGKIPYVWGGTAVPGGADCSGFVQTIYGRHGIAAPRTSEAQGGWVRRGPPIPGGLAFYHSPPGGADPGHVAIVGYGGKVISQGGGLGPQIEPLRFMPLLWTGTPPGGLAGGGGVGAPWVNRPGAWRLGGLERLWGQAGGPSRLAHLMGAIALAESAGDPRALNPSGATGLWQILGQIVPGNLFNPLVNAENAVAKWRTQGLGAWTTWRTGAYRQWYGKGGPITEPILGTGVRTGKAYGFHAGEQVTTNDTLTKAIAALAKRLDMLIEVTQRAPARTAAGVGDALNRTSRRGAAAGAYSVGG